MIGVGDEAALKDLQQALASPMSPTSSSFPATMFQHSHSSLALGHYDDFDVALSASAPPSFSGPSPDILVSPAQASPQYTM